MVYKFRVILDTEDDVFRDIAILNTSNLEDLHKAIYKSFGFDGKELASFYTCDNNWNQEDEIPLMETGDAENEMRTMKDYKILDILNTDDNKIIYLYDFINMWTFFVELLTEEKPIPKKTYPEVFFSHGKMPTEAPEKKFDEDPENYYGEFEDELDEEDLEMFDDDNIYNYGDEEER